MSQGHLKFRSQFLNYCESGNVTKIKDLLKGIDWTDEQKNLQDLLDKGLQIACHNCLELVQYLLTSPDLPIHANIYCMNYSPLIIAIESDRLDIVKYLCSIPRVDTKFQDMLNTGLYSACKKNLDIVRYLLTSCDLPIHSDIHDRNERPLQAAVDNDRLDIVQYLCISPELKEHSHVFDDDDSCFRHACNTNIEIAKFFLRTTHLNLDVSKALTYGCLGGNLELVRYVLTSPDLPIHANIHERKDISLFWAVSASQKDIFDYLCFSPEISEHIDINLHKDKLFLLCCMREQLDFAKHIAYHPQITCELNFNYVADEKITGFTYVCLNSNEDFIDFFIHELHYEPSKEELFPLENMLIYSYILKQINKRNLNWSLRYSLPDKKQGLKTKI